MIRARRTGFALLELLVVVSLLAILAAILFPVFAQVRDKGRQAVCLSHLRQLALGMLLYSDDHDDALPLILARRRDEPLCFEETWMGHLLPYLKSAAVFVDPAVGPTRWDEQSFSDLQVSYSYSPSYRAMGYEGIITSAPPFGTAMWEGLGGFSGLPLGGYRQAVPSFYRPQVARPTETILLCDHRVFDWGMSRQKIYYPAPRHLREPDQRLQNGSTVPQGRINAAFVDGHVKALKHEQFWAILPDYSDRGRPTRSVFRYFWPYE